MAPRAADLPTFVAHRAVFPPFLYNGSVRRQSLALALLVVAGVCPAPMRVAPVASVERQVAETVLEGTLEVLIEDSQQESRILYFLKSGDRRIALQIERPPPNLTTGLRVRVSGGWIDSDSFRVTTIKRL